MKRQNTSFPFQLHHTGIKTHDNFTLRKIDWYFNCTIQELKHSYKTETRKKNFISIAPYRN